MSVRGTTVARHARKVIIREGDTAGEKIFCGWADCDNDGYTTHEVRVRETRPGITPAQYARYLFCSQRHKEYFVHSHRNPGQHGRLPAGLRGTIL